MSQLDIYVLQNVLPYCALRDAVNIMFCCKGIYRAQIWWDLAQENTGELGLIYRYTKLIDCQRFPCQKCALAVHHDQKYLKEQFDFATKHQIIQWLGDHCNRNTLDLPSYLLRNARCLPHDCMISLRFQDFLKDPRVTMIAVATLVTMFEQSLMRKDLSGDVEIIQQQTGCSRIEAIYEILITKGDIVDAIMELTL